MWDPYAEFETGVLPNGLTVHAAYWPGRPWEAMGFLIHSGAEHDPVGLEGTAHFVEHLISENTILTKKCIKDFFDDCGGSVSLGSTGYPQTQYSFFAPITKSIFTKAISIFGHMLFSASLEKCIERERQVILSEFNREFFIKDKLDLLIRKHKALYANCWLERFVKPFGNPIAIEQIQQDDLRMYYDQHYTPANMSIVGVGGMTLAEIVDIISESPLAINKAGTRTPLPCFVTNILPPSENRYIFKAPAEMALTDGSFASAGIVSGNIKTQTLEIFKHMFNEVLNDEVREKQGWAYSIRSEYFNLRHFYEFGIICDSFASKALDDIENVVEKCIDSMSDHEKLFKQVKQRTLAGDLMSDLKGRDVRNGALKDLARYQRIISLTEYAQEVEKITMDDIRELLYWLRPERRWTLLVQPY
jgi:predicted Zn-dependent peptidase